MSFLLLLACTQTVVETPGAKAKPSVLLVTLDTTRADAMGTYGHAGAKTPNFDSFKNNHLQLFTHKFYCLGK